MKKRTLVFGSFAVTVPGYHGPVQVTRKVNGNWEMFRPVTKRKITNIWRSFWLAKNIGKKVGLVSGYSSDFCQPQKVEGVIEKVEQGMYVVKIETFRRWFEPEQVYIK